MKFYILVAFLVCSAHGNWLSDLFTGLGEAVEDAKVTDKLDTLGTNIKKIGKDVIKAFKTDIPNNDWVVVTKKYLEGIQFKEILKEGDEKMEVLVEKWNNILKELNNPDQFKSAKEMYEKITKDLKELLPKKLFKKWKKKVHNIAEKVRESVKTQLKGVKTQLKDVDVDTLKKHVKSWVEPTFMQHKENIEEEKQMVKDAVEAANKKLREEAEKAGKKIAPYLEMENAKELKENAEDRIEQWLAKTFTKPHHPSKWLGKLNMEQMKKQFPGVPIKRIKKLFKKMGKKNKKMIVINKPMETIIKKIPIFTEEQKKLAKLTPEERAEYLKAETDWEKKMLMEALKVSQKLAMKKGVEKKEEKKKPMMTGNEKWELLNENEQDDDEDENEFLNYQQTKPKLTKPLTKDFADKLAAEESEWYGLRKKLKAMM